MLIDYLEIISVCFKYIIYVQNCDCLIAYMSSPCHIEVVLTEKEEVVAKAAEEEPAKKKVSKKKLARQKEKMMRD